MNSAPTEIPPTESDLGATLDRMTKKRIRVFLFSSGFTLLMIGLFVGSGYILDQVLGTWPKAFVGGLVISYPVTQVYLFKKYKREAQTK